jgi:hypothetical protein
MSHANANPSRVTKRKLFNWRLFNTLSKIMVVSLVVILGMQSAYTIWFAGSVADSKFEENDSSVSDDPASDDPLAIFSDFTSGAWRFGESAWDFRILSSAAVELHTAPATVRIRDQDFDDESMINQFRDLGVTPQKLENGLEKWESSGHGFTMTLFTREGIVQMIRTQVPAEQGFTTIEAVPRSQSRSLSEAVLLPLNGDAQQTAMRVDANGQLTSAIIQLNAEKQIDIRSYWKENGWQLAPVLEFDSVELSEPVANTKFRCTKDGTIIEATFLSQPDEPHAVVILTLIASGKTSQ